jgi:hypothetical protein
MAGRPGAARAVGNIMSEGGRPDVPAHRVIAAGGRLGGYGGHEQLKRALLMAEGVRMRGTRVAIEDCRWQRSSRKVGKSQVAMSVSPNRRLAHSLNRQIVKP